MVSQDTFWKVGDQVTTRFGTGPYEVTNVEITTEPVRENAFDDEPKQRRVEWVKVKASDGEESEYAAFDLRKV